MSGSAVDPPSAPPPDALARFARLSAAAKVREREQREAAYAAEMERQERETEEGGVWTAAATVSGPPATAGAGR